MPLTHQKVENEKCLQNYPETVICGPIISFIETREAIFRLKSETAPFIQVADCREQWLGMKALKLLRKRYMNSEDGPTRRYVNPSLNQSHNTCSLT